MFVAWHFPKKMFLSKGNSGSKIKIEGVRDLENNIGSMEGTEQVSQRVVKIVQRNKFHKEL